MAEPGLRERKKARLRERLADVAADLFARHGYDHVSILDVARAADVSDQTVYNYFPSKQDLVLDRADEILRRYDRVVRERPPGTSPARAIEPVVAEDLSRVGSDDPAATGQFAVLCLQSPALRRYALELRQQQAEALARAVVDTCAGIPPLVALAHAAALTAVVQWVVDQVGASVLADDWGPADTAQTRQATTVALDDLDRHFHAVAATLQDPSPPFEEPS